jgi:hypothetical protein
MVRELVEGLLVGFLYIDIEDNTFLQAIYVCDVLCVIASVRATHDDPGYY